MTLSDIYESSPVKVDEWLRSNTFIVPTSIETPDELELASKMMAELVNWSSYLSGLLGSLKYLVRDAKNQQNKKLANELLDKKELIYYAYESANRQRETISRMITCKQIANEEMRFLGMM